MFARRIPLLILVLVTTAGCRNINSGGAGVLWTVFGGTQDEVFDEGLHLVAPWNKFYVYDIRRQDRKEDLEILTSNGLSVGLEASIRYRPIRAELAKLHTEIGPNYFEVILGPVIRAEARKIGSGYTPEEIYSTKREEVEVGIFNAVQQALEGKHVKLEAILVRNVSLPDNIRRAISEKLEEEQKALKMKFTLERERKEAERKRIEAKGIADFQNVVSANLSKALLRWKGIEATEKLATSPNARVVVIGSGPDGLPLILGGAQ